jgi:hypothetical protein
MPLDRVIARTRNSEYEITVLSPIRGEVMVRGGRFFPEPTRVRVGGASLGGSFLKLRGIYVGFSIEFWCDGDSVITCPVVSIRSLAADRVQ